MANAICESTGHDGNGNGMRHVRAQEVIEEAESPRAQWTEAPKNKKEEAKLCLRYILLLLTSRATATTRMRMRISQLSTKTIKQDMRNCQKKKRAETTVKQTIELGCMSTRPLHESAEPPASVSKCQPSVNIKFWKKATTKRNSSRLLASSEMAQLSDKPIRSHCQTKLASADFECGGEWKMRKVRLSLANEKNDQAPSACLPVWVWVPVDLLRLHVFQIRSSVVN